VKRKAISKAVKTIAGSDLARWAEVYYSEDHTVVEVISGDPMVIQMAQFCARCTCSYCSDGPFGLKPIEIFR
jgi:isopentenyl phosphate kinase